MRNFGKVWKFKTKNFTVILELRRDNNYRYDGDDENGEIQAKLNTGEYVAFDSCVRVEFGGQEIAADYLGGSVYDRDNVAEFYTSHRDADPQNRNCTLNNRNVGHYFPDMVREACAQARDWINQHQTPRMRKSS